MELVTKKIKGGGVTSPKGFKAAAVGCGIKTPEVLRSDLALIYSELPAASSALFTLNKVKAAPIRVSQTHLRAKEVRAFLMNSGNANACTGPRGIQDARRLCRETARLLDLRQRQVLISSTGIIGLPLPMDLMMPKLPDLVSQLGSTHEHGLQVAEAILTSDTRPKSRALSLELSGGTIRIGAVAKGAGMISPNMATMLCFVTTDAAIQPGELQRSLHYAVEQSFNRISVDGDMSTNDTVQLMANGAAGNKPIKAGSADARLFREALEQLLVKTAKALVKDGEKVTKFVELHVKGASTLTDAKKVAEAVGNSKLVQSSWNGEDPNWGRIMHAVGYAKARIREEMIDIYFDGLAAARSGMMADTGVTQLRNVVKKNRFSVTIDLGLGNAEYVLFCSDLSPEYVEYNRSEYAAWRRLKK
ncbi:MAG: bifunctional glutamate N-acetyltransferase/amino-acid acetyltransferase ArgJ [Verrucomicrobiota bacterium]